MTITKTITADGSRGNHRFSLTLTESKTEGNSSFLDGSFTLYPVKSGTHWDWYYWGEQISYSVNVGGNAYSGYIPNYDGTSVLYLVQISNLEIPHNSDGTKTINISFSVTDNAGQAYTPGNASASGIMELSLLHKSPQITSIDMVEENEILTTIGVGDDEFVNQLSKKTMAINTTFYDNAVGSNYKINIDPYVYTSTVSIVDVNIENRDIKYDSNNNVNVVASVTDSFGATSSYSVLRNYIPYQKPNIITTQSSVKRAGQITGKAKLNLEGTFFNGTIRNVTNTISLSYKYWAIGEVEPEVYFAIPPTAYTIDNNNFSMYNWGISKDNVEIEDLDKSKAYNFKIKVVDSLNSTSEVTLVCSKGEWVMAKFKDRVDFQKITINGRPLTDSSFCRITTNVSNLGISGYTKITDWTVDYSVGDFTYDSTNSVIKIKNTTILEITGTISGYSSNGGFWVRPLIKNLTTGEYESLNSNTNLYQMSGNGYGKMPIYFLYKLDSTIEYEMELRVTNYPEDTEFTLNSGFGSDGTFLCVKKIL